MTSLKQTDQPKKSRRQGTVKQRHKGSWEIRYYGPADHNGKQKRIQETVRGTKKEAEKVLRERLSAIEDGSHIDKSKQTVSDFIDHWLVTYVATNCTARTASGYQGNIKRYINPAIGRVAIRSLTPGQVQAIYAGMLERGLSHTTVLHTHRVLKEALGHAVKWGILTRNVADSVSPPRREEKEMEMWDIPTIHKFLDLCDNGESIYGELFSFAIHTGLRRSEVCGLKWDVVDLTEGRLSVVRTLHLINGRGLVEGLPKTKRSRRNVALAPETVALLHKVRGLQGLRGFPTTGDAYVFTRPSGLPLIPTKVTSEFTRLIRSSCLPHLTLPGLRHANATLQMAAGINPKVVSEGLGHSNISITLDLYSHVLPNMQQHAVDAVANLLKRE